MIKVKKERVSENNDPDADNITEEADTSNKKTAVDTSKIKSSIKPAKVNADTTVNKTQSAIIPNNTIKSTALLNKVNSDTTSKIKSNLNDTSGVSNTKVDSMAIDSTARLKYFTYKRENHPYTTLQGERNSPFFLYPSSQYDTREVEIDSTGKNVNIIQRVAGEKTKIILTMPLDEYIKNELALNERSDWDDLSRQYNLQNSEEGLQQVIKDITNFEIPLPKVGVLSIFGKPQISLKIAGAVDIHGAWQSQTTEGVTASLLGNTTNTPDFSQQVQLNVDGTIGDKLNINANWNTESQFEYQNQLNIKYTGYPDEIIQSVEAGNVSLQTSPLVGGSDALFGIKAEFQLGPLDLTTIASQKKGEEKVITLNGGSQSQTFSIHAYGYSTNHYFLDTVYSSRKLNLFEQYYGSSPHTVGDNGYYIVTDIEVWKSTTVIGGDKSKIRYANAYINLPALSPNQTYNDIGQSALRKQIQTVPGQQETGKFVELTEGTDYTLEPNTGYISFNTQINDQDVIAVAYRIQGPTGSSSDDQVYGEFLKNANALQSQNPSDSVIVLKLVKPSYLLPSEKEAWSLLMKNIYPLPGRGINQNNFQLDIQYEIPGQDPVDNLGSTKFLNAFGLDKYNQSGQATPDNQFDWEPGYTILPATGEIIFPTLEPFGKDLPSSIPDSMNYPDVYDTLAYAAQQDNNKDKWIISGQYSGSVTSTYNLGFNVVENSVHVYLNGTELTPNVDYTVDYNVGQLTIRNDAALVPGANLKVTFEQNDIFSLASKTLLGARAILNISDKTKWGFSILNLNQETLSDKVQIGEEPFSNTIMGSDFNTAGDLPFLTNALDHVISTKAKSSFGLSGEVAYINPTPNTKTSTITSDNGQSVAYIDDFEGSKQIIPIGVSYNSWKDLSPPGDLPLLNDTSAADMMKYKAHSFWFNFTPSQVTVTNIWGNVKQVAQEDESEPVLDYVYMPDTPGTDNHYPNLKGNLGRNWGGVMKNLSSTSTNLTEENIEYIEFWMNTNGAPKDANLYIDLGRISEDVIPDGQLETEDKNGNQVTDPGEDVGLDGLTDQQEQKLYPNEGSDPDHDDFVAPKNLLNIMDYYSINGTEGNASLADGSGRIPDTEDLNNNGNLDVVNSYFRYKVSLNTDTTNKFIAGSGGQGSNGEWHLFRIPLSDTMLTVGNPSFSSVQYIRMFITGVSQMIHLSFAEFNLVGNQWQNPIPNDTTMKVSVINLEDNSNVYYMPPGLTRAKDNTRPDQNIYENEQSMNLIFTNLPKGESRDAVKYLYNPIDVFNYTQMKLFIHGDLHPPKGNLAYSDPQVNEYSANVYFKFGTDSSNYYEYIEPLVPDWQNIVINFSDITSIKEAKGDTLNGVITHEVPGMPGHFYKVKGQPTLTSIKYLDVGVININDNSAFNPGPLSGDVWVNELRVLGADSKPGWAYSVSGNLALADLMTVNFNMSQTSPEFHSLTEQFGSRVLTKNWAFSTNLNVLKLLPFELPNSNFKVNYSHSESIGKPKYFPGTDIEVDAAAALAEQGASDSALGITETPDQIKAETQTVNVTDVLSASAIQLEIPSSYWLVRDTWNRLTFAFNYNKNFARSPTILSSKSWAWAASADYSLNLNPNYFFYPVKIPLLGSILGLFSDYRDLKVYFTPQSFGFNVSANRTRSTSTTRALDNTPEQTSITRNFTAQRGFNFNWNLTQGGLLNLSMNYTNTTYSSLLYLETDAEGNQISSSQIFSDIFSGAFFGQDYRYTQSFDLKSQPILPSIWDLNKYFSINGDYSSSYEWDRDFSSAELGVSAGFSARSSVSLILRLKALTDPIFSNLTEENRDEATYSNFTAGREERNAVEQQRHGNNEVKNDTTRKAKTDTSLGINIVKKKQPLKDFLLFFESLIHYTLFDYENVNLNFTNSNSESKSGLQATGTGFDNFWGFKLNYSNGPSRLFMLGLNDDAGPRAANATLQDVFSEQNDLSFSTSRPLWQGATIDITWDINWTLNKNTSLQSDAYGNTSVTNLSTSGTISRSFFTLPPVLFFSMFKSGIKQVHALDPNAQDLSDAFVKGFETLPILAKLGPLADIAQYIPRPNWTITWNGLENIPLFHNITKSMSLSSGYASTYTEGWEIDPDGIKEIESQRIQYGFSPLLGLTTTFAELWGGNLNSSIRYSTNTTYDLGLSTNDITETYSKQIGITAGYSKSGFELPLFGISLKNDIDFSLSYTYAENTSILFDMVNYTDSGIPQNGTISITVEPNIKYTVSSKVTVSIFYTRTTVEPEGASTVPPTVTNEAGLDVHISIQ
jgi:cell surface protein SprA